MPKGLQWSVDDVYNAERQAKIQAREVAAAMRAEYDRVAELEAKKAQQARPVNTRSERTSKSLVSPELARDLRKARAMLKEYEFQQYCERAAKATGLTPAEVRKYDYAADRLLTISPDTWYYVSTRYPGVTFNIEEIEWEQGMTRAEAEEYAAKTFNEAEHQGDRDPKLETLMEFKRKERDEAAARKAEWERRRAARLAREAQAAAPVTPCKPKWWPFKR